ncbi:MAG: sarcosine oxidase subunit gamma [Paracoccaceae bacterium]|nr:sarcosine oxidase subunit gamma [Paracoccaceae bacterium]
MHDLIAITPLGGTAAQVDNFSGVEISEQPDWALASVTVRHGQTEAVKEAAISMMGINLPDVGHVTSGPEMSAFWIGPDQWMVEASHTHHERLSAELKAGFSNFASVTEQTDGWARFDVDGPKTVAMFERLCPLNARAMTTDRVSRSSIEHLGCFVVCRSASQYFSVFCPRSSAASLHHALCTAVQSLD